MGSALEQWLESHDVHSTAGTFRRTFEPGEGSSLALTDEDLADGVDAAPGRPGAETRRGEPLGVEEVPTRKGVPLSKRSKLIPIVAVVGALIGVSAAVLLALRGSPQAGAQPPVPSAEQPAAQPSALIVTATPTASAAPTASASAAESASTSQPTTPAKTTAPARTGPAPARTGSKKGPVPAIPVEPNF